MSQYDEHQTDAAVIADVAELKAVAENSAEKVDVGVPGAVTARAFVRLLRAEGVDETLLDPDEYADKPRWKTGTVRPGTVPSLIRYVGRHKREGTEVWVDPEKGRFEAVIDDHSEGADTEAYGLAGWGRHRAVCELKPTPDWLHWTRQDGKLLDQVGFAEHVEAGLHNVVDPPAADFLEIAQTLQGSRSVAWKSATRLSDGQVGFRYEEDNQARAAGGVEIPQTFTLVLAPFEGTEPVQLVASFRWRLADGRVSLGYRLQRPDVVLREAVDGLIDQVESQLGLDVLIGYPRAAER